MKIAEVAARCGLSIDTIRYYEKAGICTAIQRGSDGKRRFSQENLDWLILLASLRETGMPNRKMKHFADLYQRGDATVCERKEMLRDHQKHLELQQSRLPRCRTLLDHKLGLYDEILGGKL
ncbi:MerR family transcriptional regulator [Nisaea sp.]|uniref:MerR family transcriptional regulator n=1 Tax=Nisaea sp. TaxID=2024842 RepID=UPI003296A755